jgi:hypothetical protein
MNATAAQHTAPTCENCRHFHNDPAFLERAWAGLSIMSSAYGSVRANDGLCDLHNLYLSSADSCPDHSPLALNCVR